MSPLELRSNSEAMTRTLGAALATVARAGDVVTLDGDLGSGKTRFAQGVARGLGIERAVTSPTFALLEVYDEGRLPLHHFDLYRLETADDLESIDFHATVEDDGLSIIEWAERFADELPSDRIAVRFVADGEASASRRTLICTATGPESERLLADWKAAL